MTIFLDTSALYAAADTDDEAHGSASETLDGILAGEEDLVTSNYVAVELLALLGSRLGARGPRWFHDDILPTIRTEWVTRQDHAMALAAYLAAGRRKLSFVDCSSFEVMRRLGLERAFAIDRHFREHGFDCLP